MEIICHILTSLDGKIEGAFFQHEKTKPALQAYAKLRDEFAVDGIVYGKNTMLGFCQGRIEKVPKAENPPEKVDYIAKHAQDIYVICLDPLGELAFDCAIFERPGRERAHIIQVLCENVSPDYLAYLQNKDISYLFAGKESLDIKRLIEKLEKHFAIKRLMVAGGGITDYSFAKDNLIDELSLVVAPVAEVDREAAALFDRAEEKEGGPVSFDLQQVKEVEGALWLDYRNRSKDKNQDETYTTI